MSPKIKFGFQNSDIDKLYRSNPAKLLIGTCLIKALLYFNEFYSEIIYKISIQGKPRVEFRAQRNLLMEALVGIVGKRAQVMEKGQTKSLMVLLVPVDWLLENSVNNIFVLFTRSSLVSGRLWLARPPGHAVLGLRVCIIRHCERVIEVIPMQILLRCSQLPCKD